MKRFLMTLALLSAASLGAKWLAEKFVIKADENDPDGFILQSEGFGLDDIAVAVVFGLTGALALSFLGGAVGATAA